MLILDERNNQKKVCDSGSMTLLIKGQHVKK